jgi:hypothetical protein
LQYNRARYYDAKVGRWINQDPLGFDAGDSNLYRYTSNNYFKVDPSGLEVRLYLDRPKKITPIIAPDQFHVEVMVGPSAKGKYLAFNGVGGVFASGLVLEAKRRELSQFRDDIKAWTNVISPYANSAQEVEALEFVFKNLRQLPYNPFGANSNTFARQLLELAGFTVYPLYRDMFVQGEFEGMTPPRTPLPREPVEDMYKEYKPVRPSWFPPGMLVSQHIGPTATIGWATSGYGGDEFTKLGRKRNNLSGMDEELCLRALNEIKKGKPAPPFVMPEPPAPKKEWNWSDYDRVPKLED